MTARITRRAWLGLAALAAAVAAWRPRPARAQGNLANLAPEEPIAETMKRLFGGRSIKDGASLITIDMPLIAEDGAVGADRGRGEVADDAGESRQGASTSWPRRTRGRST